MVPPELEKVLKNILKQQFNEKPEYQKIRDTLKFLLNKTLDPNLTSKSSSANVAMYHQFEWMEN